jgi:hypothetical protein
MKPSLPSKSWMSLFCFLMALGPVGCGSGSGDKPGGMGRGDAAGSAGGGSAVAGTGGGTAASGGRGGAGGTGGVAGAPGAPPDAASGGTGGGAPDGGGAGSGGARADAGGRGRDSGAASDGPGAADTWESYAKSFFSTYCASCHNDDNSGDPMRDYRILANVVREKAKIACGVTKSMMDWTARGCTGAPRARLFPIPTPAPAPPGPVPSDAERDRIIRWIDSGAR